MMREDHNERKRFSITKDIREEYSCEEGESSSGEERMMSKRTRDDDESSSSSSASSSEVESSSSSSIDSSDDLSSSVEPSEKEQDASSQSSSSKEKECDEDDSLPLAIRVKRQDERGIDLTDQRNRRAKAVKVARERLATAKEEKQQKPGASAENGSNQKKKNKKKSRHAPAEASSKRIDFIRQKKNLNQSGIGVEIGAHRYKPRDPRQSSLHGHLDLQNFERNYSFLNDIREKEIALLKKRIAARGMSGRKGQQLRRKLGLTTATETLEDDKAELDRLQQEKASFERNLLDRAARRAVKKKLQEQVAEGKRGVYFPKRKELRRLHLEAKFEEIRKRGGDQAVQKAVAKRRKKNKSKDSGLLGGPK
jgi:ribosomal RNA-processing protein 36